MQSPVRDPPEAPSAAMSLSVPAQQLVLAALVTATYPTKGPKGQRSQELTLVLISGEHWAGFLSSLHPRLPPGPARCMWPG